MIQDTVDRETVAKMVRHFYAAILEDEILRPYFVRKLGEDFTGTRWENHLKILDNFWMKMMTGRAGYQGDPFPSHAFIGQMYPETFEQWLKLFKVTINQFFVPEIADKFYRKADILAEQFMQYLEIGKYADDEEEDY